MLSAPPPPPTTPPLSFSEILILISSYSSRVMNGAFGRTSTGCALLCFNYTVILTHQLKDKDLVSKRVITNFLLNQLDYNESLMVLITAL